MFTTETINDTLKKKKMNTKIRHSKTKIRDD